ncbi:hypothetical protein J8L88_10530 [Aquimarina sp. MMG015]|uniref:SPFH domain-containing protein n=1 Tax=Aquimarina sp. MMG015 TaxID=2822689 RepID=UPI001B3A6A83|nr:SPFH domain-containing protein [Aquimarina sp. MMG015]MBQ4803284.1 hypothetical protein [Aquimarina sp. MMG015]
MSENLIPFMGIAIGLIILIILFNFIILIISYKKPKQGQAIIRSGLKGVRIGLYRGIYVIPLFHKMEYIDLTLKKINIEHKENQSVICKDFIRADIKVNFHLSISNTPDDILRTSTLIGCEKTFDETKIKDIFLTKFSEVLKTIAFTFEYGELHNKKTQFRDEIIILIGTDLYGYVLEDVIIEYIKQTPITFLNPNDVLDSKGIKKIKELTEIKNFKN